MPHLLVRSLTLAALVSVFTSMLSAATLATFAGNGSEGAAGDHGPALAAQLADPAGIARGPDGALYICDTANHRICKVTPDGKLATVAGTGQPGYSGDGGPAIAAKLHEPYEVRFDAKGDVFWVERLSNSVRKLDVKTGIIRTIAGNGTSGFSGDGGPATAAQLSDPHSIGFDRAGDLYICDVRNHRIRKVAMKTGIITTFAGNGEKLPTPDGAPFASSPLFGPRALDFDRDGNLWLALREGNAVYKLDLAKGTVHHVAGTGKKGFTGDGGPAKDATLNGPKGLAVAPNGNIYLADTENHAVRMIDLKRGTLELTVGNGKKGDGPDGDTRHAQLARPHGVFVDADGTLFIGDTENYRIRTVLP